MLIDKKYKATTCLLLKCLSEVAKENVFALYGGTAINFFLRNMPRTSIDIDLAYIPIQDRNTSLSNILSSLRNIEDNIKSNIPETKVFLQEDIFKIRIKHLNTQVKLEVNTTNRGLLNGMSNLKICEKIQIEFGSSIEMQIVSFEQLYGSKIKAALTRQHPRDLFDVMCLLNDEGITEEIKKCFIYAMLIEKIEPHKIISPVLIDQRKTYVNRFQGMNYIPFSYEIFENTRKKLINNVQSILNEADKEFILDFFNATPNWKLYDFEKFPAIKWRLLNLNKFKNESPQKHTKFLRELEKTFLSSIN